MFKKNLGTFISQAIITNQLIASSAEDHLINFLFIKKLVFFTNEFIKENITENLMEKNEFLIEFKKKEEFKQFQELIEIEFAFHKTLLSLQLIDLLKMVNSLSDNPYFNNSKLNRHLNEDLNDIEFKKFFKEMIIDYYLRIKEKSEKYVNINYEVYVKLLKHSVEILNTILIDKEYNFFEENFDFKLNELNLERANEQNLNIECEEKFFKLL